MNARTGLLLLVLAGCASAPPPAARLVDTVQVSADPYAVEPRDATRVARVVARVADWSDARHVRAIERFMESGGDSPADLIAFVRNGVEITGTASQVQAVATFLADRAVFQDARIHLTARFIRVERDKLPKLLSLETSPLGFGWAVLPRYAVPPLLDRHRAVQRPSVTAFDAQASTVYVGDLPASRFKRSGRAGFTLRTSGVLSAGGTLLVLDLGSEVSSLPASFRPESSENWLRVPVRKDDQQDDHVALPRLRHAGVEGRFRLRAGESLLLLTDDPGGDALMIVLSWSRVGH